MYGNVYSSCGRRELQTGAGESIGLFTQDFFIPSEHSLIYLIDDKPFQ
jgi:hypothetical protein